MHFAVKLSNLLAVAVFCSCAGQNTRISGIEDANLTGSGREDGIVRQNFHPFVEGGINKLITRCLVSGYQYLAMAFHFDRADQAYKGFRNFFKDASDREHENANKLMTYINRRGGSVALKNVKAPERMSWSEGLKTMEMSLRIERNLNADILALHDLGKQMNDPHFTHYLEEELLEQKVNTIKKLGDYIQQLQTIVANEHGLGNFIFDRSL